MIEETPKMEFGAVAIIDALGFRGIWKKFADVDVPLKKMEALLQVADIIDSKEKEAEEKSGPHSLQHKILLLSDTIVIAFYFPNGAETKEELRIIIPLQKVAEACCGLITKALEGLCPITYRGAISIGNFIIKENFLIGPAVDDAAQYSEVAEGAMVWVTPEAIRTIRSRCEHTKAEDAAHDSNEVVTDRLIKPRLYTKYTVPLKSGGTYNTLVVDPLRDLDSSEAVMEFLSNTIESFEDSRVDVRVKMQNTLSFYNHLSKIPDSLTGE